MPTARDIILRTAVTHTVTYFIAGVAAFVLWDYPTLMSALGGTTRPLTDPIEGLIYTVLPLSAHLKMASEVVVQSLLLSALLCYWVNHRDKKWLNWTMGAAFLVVLALPLLGLLTQSPPDPLN